MIILSHRGYWREAAEKNSPTAFHRSFDLGFGTETDIRDAGGGLVVAHDMPQGGELTLDGLLGILAGRGLPLAINIKADGLARLLLEVMNARGVARWFTFDMSIPETIQQLRLGLPVFTRASEYETPPVLYDRARGVWVDDFGAQWITAKALRAFLADGKQVCVVSPELHGRDPLPLWRELKAGGLVGAPGLMLCSDRAEDARDFFGVAA
jgi:glycerophosphoryl diester phosphodiesterase